MVAFLLAAVVVAATPTRVLVMDFKASGVEPAVAVQVTAMAAQALQGAPELAVLSMADVRELMSADKTRTMLGCASDTCVAELANASNVDLVITGTVGRVGTQVTAAMGLVDAKTASVRAREQVDAPSAVQLLRVIGARVRKLMGLGEAAAVNVVAPGKAVSLAVMDLVPAGVAPDVVTNLTQVLGTELRRLPGASIISRDDIQAMLQMQADKLKMGCDDASCLAEIGGALGVEKLVVGNVGKVADTYTISLRLISVRTTTVDNRVTEAFSGAEDQLIRAVRHAGRKLVGLGEVGKGTLSVGAAQEGAEIVVDGIGRGRTPGKPVGDLVPGPHAVSLRKGGYLEWSGEAYVDPEDTTVVFVNLVEKPLRWYQRWQVWTLAAVGAGTLVAVVAALVASGVVAGIYVWRTTTAPPPSGGGSVTVE